jgi:UPF0755 protein
MWRNPRGAGEPQRRKGLIVALLAASATFSVFLIGALAVLWSVYFGPGPEARGGQETTIVSLPSGAGVSAIAANLKAAGVIKSTDMFRAAATFTGADRKLRAGEYEVPSRASLKTVLGLLTSGRVVRHFVTIPEGWSSAQAVDILMKQSVLTGTVEIRSPATVVSSPEEAVVLASIVEKETGVASERPRVAAVFSNRIRTGMRLESDPTIVYGITKGRPLGRGIRLSELQRETPWNTYLVDGLPPTPIANPGRDAIAAVLNPPRTDELFFVADGTGGHVFARTFEEHLRNVARWREIERRKAGLPPTAAPPATAGTVPTVPNAPVAAGDQPVTAPAQGQATITVQGQAPRAVPVG